jgi:hypothetical protein
VAWGRGILDRASGPNAGNVPALSAPLVGRSDELAALDAVADLTSRLLDGPTRLLRASGEPDQARSLLEQADRWYRTSGGGDGARLARCLLAAITDDADGLRAALEEAQGADDQEVQALALDARLSAERDELVAASELLRSAADDLIPAVQHVVDEPDRFDAYRARGLIS